MPPAVDFYSSGYLALWSSLFGVWSAIFYIHTGRFIYPFLGTSLASHWWTEPLGLVLGLPESPDHCLMSSLG